jgi:copper(I)-binding protein
MPRSPSVTLFGTALLALAALAVHADGSAVSVSDAYARAIPPGQPNSAVFLTLNNPSGQPRALVAAASPVADAVELHTHIEEGGMMRMRRVERIEVPAGESVSLKPGGLHVMLIGLTRDLNPGETFPVTLQFEPACQVSFARGRLARIEVVEGEPIGVKSEFTYW